MKVMAVDSKKLVVSLFSVVLLVLFVGAVARVQKDEAVKPRFVCEYFCSAFDC